MKRCTYCGKEYPDDATECIIDRQPLADFPPKPASTETRTDNENKTVVIRIFDRHEAAQLAAANLKSHGIECWVTADDCGGMYPNLTVAAGVRLRVRVADVEAAVALLDTPLSPAETEKIETDAVTAAPPEIVPAQNLAWGQILLGLVAGIILCLFCLPSHHPGTKTVYEHTRGGKVSAAWVYKDDHLVEVLRDRNLDGKWDYWSYYQYGFRERSEEDNNFDGKPDEWWEYSNGEAATMEKDTDFNGLPDVFATYEQGLIQQLDIKPNGSKFVTEREIYRNNVLTEILRGGDSNGVFKEDVLYDPFFNPISTNANGIRSVAPQ
jgi:hypothetical protein